MNNPVAVQLYTLRDLTAKDFAGTLRQVSQAGYRAVEMAGYGGLAAGEMKKLLDELELQVAGSHMGIGEIENDLPAACDYCKTIGTNYLVVPAVPLEYRDDADGFRRAGERIGKAAVECEKHGVAVVYHTHGFDFQRFNGKLALDLLLESAAPANVLVEIDTFWAKDKGEDPAEMIRHQKNRCPLVHLKDKPASGPAHDCEIGVGTIDFAAVNEAAKEVGAEWLIVEQEDCRKPPIQSITESLNFLKSAGIA
jgi:sugar phosphate isomerase/epimerase